MTRLQVRPLERADAAEAAELLAARFGAAQKREVALAPGASDTRACRAALEALLDGRLTQGAIASFAGRPLGYWIAQRNLSSPGAAQAYFSPPYSVGAALHAHAFPAERRVAEGFLAHSLGVLDVERERSELEIRAATETELADVYALLQHALAWMRRDGVSRCALHFLARTVDARMAWSGR